MTPTNWHGNSVRCARIRLHCSLLQDDSYSSARQRSHGCTGFSVWCSALRANLCCGDHVPMRAFGAISTWWLHLTPRYALGRCTRDSHAGSEFDSRRYEWMYAQPFINWTQTEVDDPNSLRFQLDPNDHRVSPAVKTHFRLVKNVPQTLRAAYLGSQFPAARSHASDNARHAAPPVLVVLLDSCPLTVVCQTAVRCVLLWQRCTWTMFGDRSQQEDRHASSDACRRACVRRSGSGRTGSSAATTA
jgi:hypothetical protein